MPVTVIVGGQFGSEGKGKVSHFLSRELNASAAIRVGGSNSGHTVIDSLGKPIILRQLPTASIIKDVYCVISAGSYIDREILLNEIEYVGISSERLLIDPHAIIITDSEKQEEQQSLLKQAIGSTLSGTGAAVLKRIKRSTNIKLAKDEISLRPFVKTVIPFLRDCLDAGKRIIIEGTQGFGLSLLHSPYYPYVTSRDTTAAGFLSEVGLSPLDVDQIVLVLRSFPIRVAGNSGYLPHEINWQTVTCESGRDQPIIEYTSVTHSIRRVARFDPEVVRQAITVNQPTHIVLNHLDYIDDSYISSGGLSNKVINFVSEIESMIDQNINYLGFSPCVTLVHSN